MACLCITDRQVGDVTVLELEGDVIFGQGNLEFRDRIRREINEGKKKFLLNLGGVKYIDSSGIGELISGLIAVSRVGGSLGLFCIPTRVAELLSITKLLDVFPTWEREKDALKEFDAQSAKTKNF